MFEGKSNAAACITGAVLATDTHKERFYKALEALKTTFEPSRMADAMALRLELTNLVDKRKLRREEFNTERKAAKDHNKNVKAAYEKAYSLLQDMFEGKSNAAACITGAVLATDTHKERFYKALEAHSNRQEWLMPWPYVLN